jgi:hypothetical protein
LPVLTFLCAKDLEEIGLSQDEMIDDLAERMKRMQVKAREKAQKRNPSATLKRHI